MKNLLKSFLNPVKEVNIGKGTETGEKGDGGEGRHAQHSLTAVPETVTSSNLLTCVSVNEFSSFSVFPVLRFPVLTFVSLHTIFVPLFSDLLIYVRVQKVQIFHF